MPLYANMRCILVYNKYRPGQVQVNIFLACIFFIHEYVDIKNIDLVRANMQVLCFCQIPGVLRRWLIGAKVRVGLLHLQ